MAKRRKKNQALVPVETKPDTDRLLGDLRSLIDSAHDRVAQAVNAGLVLLYWSIGERIRRESWENSVLPMASKLSRQCRHN